MRGDFVDSNAARQRLVLRQPTPADFLGRHRRRLANSGGSATTLMKLFLEDGWSPLNGRQKLAAFWRWYWLVAVVETRHRVRRHRHRVDLPPWRQRAQARWLAWSRLVPPLEYYRYGLHDLERRQHLDELMFRYSLKGWAYERLHRKHRSTQLPPLNDKLAFEEHCSRHDLPTIPIIGITAGGDLEWVSQPHTDLFAKPLDQRGGEGAEVWRRTSRGAYKRHGERLTVKKLGRRFATLPQSYLISPRYRNHAALADLEVRALCTIRAVTILDEAGVPELAAAVFRMPQSRRRIVDNGHAGGIAAPVDLSTGTLGPALRLMNSHRLESHPASGAQIAGRVLPRWAEVAELATRAHRAFMPRVIVAWDIAVTDDEAVLVEGNARPGVDLIQQTHGPLGQLRLGKLLVHHLTELANCGDPPRASPGNC